MNSLCYNRHMKIAIEKLKEINAQEIKRALKSIIDALGGVERFVSPGDKVLIKPNLLSPSKIEEARITDPRLIEAMVQLIHPIASEIWIGDSSGVSTRSATRETMKSAKLDELPNLYPKVKLRNFDEEEKRITKISLGKRGETQVALAEAVFQADKVINLPKLKTHNFTIMTCAVKNTFGCLPGSQKARIHAEAKDPISFSHALIDIHLEVKPTLSIVDATLSMEGEGPAWGKPIETGLIFGGESAFAVDMVAAKIMGLRPEKVPTIKVAQERGLNPSEIEIEGESLSNISFNFKTPRSVLFIRTLPSFIWRSFTPRVRMNQEKCIKCGICASNCPAKAIALDPFPQVDDSRCILCFCCHELCPVGAVYIQERLLSKILLRGVI
ncbi:MAG: DUF362 domain-containing protein [Synergistetes bacterium]|nr:DUF362 domain-containing protein [Synergistota bacterium]